MATKKISEITNQASASEVASARFIASVPDGDGYDTKYVTGNTLAFATAGPTGSGFSLWQDASGDEPALSSNIEYSPPDQGKSFAHIYFYTNFLNWNEYAYFRYYYDTSDSYREIFRAKGAGDGGGAVINSNLIAIPLYINALGNKVVRVTWSNMAHVRGKWWT